jgi:alpha-L-fucosidase
VDVERGLRSEISPEPWQTDTCIGDWHYDRRIFEEKRYLPAAEVIHRLCDIVSKNGNLLLSIPVRGDGTIDSEERRIVEEIGGWMRRFSEAIHGTRPWTIFGEGTTAVAGGMFNEGNQKPFTPRDIRFTTKGDALYAITLGQPEGGEVVVTTLGTDGRHAQRPVRRVAMVGDKTPLPFRQDRTGLRVTLPASGLHPFGVALRVEGVLSR